jgi:tetratricopeptide (TPR) repeat protein
VHIREIYRLRGESALQQGQFSTAAGFYLDTITLGRKSGIPVAGLLGRLAYTRVRENFHDEARALIEEALDNEDPVRIHDLYNSAAEVYLALGDEAQAADYAYRAYETAWADGEPYVWRWRLDRARAVLASLNLPEPDMPAFHADRIEQIPFEDEIFRFVENLQNGE